MCKNLVLLRDVISVHHPKFKASADLRQLAQTNPTMFNVERLIEETLAAVGPYDYVDEEGYDFTDYSDSKTVTVNINTRRAEIGNVETKIGALRITAYNPHTDSLDYFFVPKHRMSYVKSPCYGIQSHKERIQFSWTVQKDYGWFEDFRVDNFTDLALAS